MEENITNPISDKGHFNIQNKVFLQLKNMKTTQLKKNKNKAFK